MQDLRDSEAYSLLKKVNFSSLVMKTEKLKSDLDQDLEWAKTPKDIDDKIANRIK
jgi:hypothetical protein